MSNVERPPLVPAVLQINKGGCRSLRNDTEVAPYEPLAMTEAQANR